MYGALAAASRSGFFIFEFSFNAQAARRGQNQADAAPRGHQADHPRGAQRRTPGRGSLKCPLLLLRLKDSCHSPWHDKCR